VRRRPPTALANRALFGQECTAASFELGLTGENFYQASPRRPLREIRIGAATQADAHVIHGRRWAWAAGSLFIRVPTAAHQ
jgi:hypothetical protein